MDSNPIFPVWWEDSTLRVTKEDLGFYIFYMGINLGAFLAPLFCGWVGETYNWHYGFGLAAIGMAIGQITYYLGQKYLVGVWRIKKNIN